MQKRSPTAVKQRALNLRALEVNTCDWSYSLTVDRRHLIGCSRLGTRDTKHQYCTQSSLINVGSQSYDPDYSDLLCSPTLSICCFRFDCTGQVWHGKDVRVLHYRPGLSGPGESCNSGEWICSTVEIKMISGILRNVSFPLYMFDSIYECVYSFGRWGWMNAGLAGV